MNARNIAQIIRLKTWTGWSGCLLNCIKFVQIGEKLFTNSHISGKLITEKISREEKTDEIVLSIARRILFMKKLITLLLALVMALSLTGMAFAEDV
ncbi:MAG: hypothetical protein J6M47_12395, partial [Clostridia bacterium]|nr:hypothetical protein [Clostridia bacterium]